MITYFVDLIKNKPITFIYITLKEFPLKKLSGAVTVALYLTLPRILTQPTIEVLKTV